ncbi:hypothetical protein cyc_00904 [Cyclospora cayetanensis]|uniref:Transmembrane protein n=1 Tax=Cyclospora cayetanensis TaxID=88456 RepID=A0A1D3D2K5_9EIME|nr:hypothetical protein cyc_00904 [Cyclospora cayetanensis]
MDKEDWTLLLISLGWCGIFVGAYAFNAWRLATRGTRHPYLADAMALIESNKSVMESLGAPLEMKAVEEHSESFAPWKRLVLQLTGPNGTTKIHLIRLYFALSQAFVCARRVGYSEEDLIEQISEEEEGPIWSRPYLLKQWLLQGISDLWNVSRQLFSGRKSCSDGSSGVGKWEIISLFVLTPESLAPGAAEDQGAPSVILLKGRSTDNPDWYSLISPKLSMEKLFSHWIANACLLLVCLYSIRRVRAEWKMAAERLSSLRFVNHFITHHRHLQQLAARQLQDAIVKRSPSRSVPNDGKHSTAVPVRLRYFTGQLSQEAIDGVAHLEIYSGDDAGDDPDFTDKLQCELRLQASRPSASVPYVAFQSTLSLIQEPRDHTDPPFPVVHTYALDPRALTRAPEP